MKEIKAELRCPEIKNKTKQYTKFKEGFLAYLSPAINLNLVMLRIIKKMAVSICNNELS